MGLLTNLSKLGINKNHLFDDEINAKKKEEDAKKSVGIQKSKEELESERLIDRTVTCKCCQEQFVYKSIRASKVRRMQPDADLRPRAEHIDPLKYNMISCPYCGYSAMVSEYDKISDFQIKLIRENICKQFEPRPVYEGVVYTYEHALERYEMGLASTIVKKGKIGDRARYCLYIAWLLREMADLEEKGSLRYEVIKKEEKSFYRQAYDGLRLAMETEWFPICGMDEDTLNYMLAYMAVHFQDYKDASKLISNILVSQTASNRLKDMGRDLKDELLALIMKNEHL